jgi:hypothetical protein
MGATHRNVQVGIFEQDNSALIQYDFRAILPALNKTGEYVVPSIDPDLATTALQQIKATATNLLTRTTISFFQGLVSTTASPMIFYPSTVPMLEHELVAIKLALCMSSML